MQNPYKQVENIYVNPGESQAVVAKIMALTRENAVFDKQKPYKLQAAASDLAARLAASPGPEVVGKYIVLSAHPVARARVLTQ